MPTCTDCGKTGVLLTFLTAEITLCKEDAAKRYGPISEHLPFY